jgi:ABC-type protease/lipase transport system fused ATPase/permease subunit
MFVRSSAAWAGAFFDLPWLPFYLAICFAFHVLIGLTALVGAIILVTLTLVTEFMSREPARQAMGLAARRNDLAASSRRNAEVLVAMGMSGRLAKRWSEANENYLAGNQRASDVAGGLVAIAKVMRMMLQSAVLAVGAYLVIHQEATAALSSPVRSWPRGRWRRSIWPSRIGKASLPRGRAGNA